MSEGRVGWRRASGDSVASFDLAVRIAGEQGTSPEWSVLRESEVTIPGRF